MRRWIFVTLLAGLILAFATLTHAQEKVITWKLAGVWGPGDASYMPETFAKMINEKSKGRLKVVTYPSGQLYGAKELFGALQKGLIDSTGILEVISFIEEKFGISVKDDELVPENLDSIRCIADFVGRKRGVRV